MSSDSKRIEAAIDTMLATARSRDVSEQGRAHIAELLTVWASGYLEATCREVLKDYTTKRAHENVTAYVCWHLERFRNVRVEGILQLVGHFDKDAAGRLRQFADGRIQECVNSIVGIRHKVAHGRSAEVSIARITEYLRGAKDFANKMREVMGTNVQESQ